MPTFPTYLVLLTYILLFFSCGFNLEDGFLLQLSSTFTELLKSIIVLANIPEMYRDTMESSHGCRQCRQNLCRRQEGLGPPPQLGLASG